MLFNSFEFIFLFLPIVLIGYYAISKITVNSLLANLWLLLASLTFYGWNTWSNVILILSSILINFAIGMAMEKLKQRKALLILGIFFNIFLLCYYKYTDFLLSNINAAFHTDFNLLHIILPIGISFFTFQQIAFLVDTYKREISEYNLLSYSIFVSFFPQLIAGPIVHHKEMMPQFKSSKSAQVSWFNISKGVFVFNMGLAKKIIIADTFGKIASRGYAHTALLDTGESWITSLAYSTQLYFDFSGYSDMAIGLGLLFNIQLPNNFWSPYKSTSIKEFWRRWHMTLSRFLKDYIYIPLGGNRVSTSRTHINLLLTFLIGGFWHGAGWTFIFWGFLHGAGLVLHSMFQKTEIKLPTSLSILLTFLFVNITWIFFRAENWNDALNVVQSMFGLSHAHNDFSLIYQFYDVPIWCIGLILLFVNNSTQFSNKYTINWRFALFTIFLILINLIFLNSDIKQEFLYFDF
ncbi:acetyltransferase [Reichenbachiella sp. 5M10]|uniref:MBOAT family O-acyltransferase n=1 Tax=Reichenbachiella sp. 5M10 TaxID=1889772 RepID=UPI000C15C668|nr:MBOAT family O-acyltransferase [Reichenbachiella sp. 5M10]PIB34640.1 acetyltransferase [Reichenbachiella sp. 5M10]